MAHDANLYITLAFSGLAGLAMLTMAGLSGWRSWISLKRQELSDRSAAALDEAAPSAAPSAASRIEIADLKERIRKLEAIAAGVDL